MNSSPHETTFLCTNTLPPEDKFFQGYCFYSTDYIFSQDGVSQFEETTGRKVTGGLDGCYVLAQKFGDSYVFTNDYAGYKLLYYYHDGENWAVSNSLAQIVDYLERSNLRITPNYAQLASILEAGSGNSQLFSFETVVQNIRLAPRAVNLIVTPDKVVLERWKPIPTMDYKAGLAAHLDLWTGRFETFVLDTRVNVSLDITGGVDSRTNFGLISLAKQRLDGEGTYPRFNCGSSESNMDDLRVAKKLGEHFELEINDSRRFPGYNLSPEECVETFRNLNVGVSYTLYLPTEGPTPFKISIGGGGGEIHRQFYEGHIRSKDPQKFLHSYSSRLRYPWLSTEFARNGQEALDIATPRGSDPLRAHYREFRHRFHVGRAPRYTVNFTPLDSVSADLTQSQAGYNRLDVGQFNYDVLASLNPDLLSLPFDKESKAPNKQVKSQLTTVEPPTEPRPGEVWAPTPTIRKIERSTVKRNVILKDMFEQALENDFTREFWGEEVAQEGSRLLEILTAGRGIGNAVNGKPISAILATALASPR